MQQVNSWDLVDIVPIVTGPIGSTTAPYVW